MTNQRIDIVNALRAFAAMFVAWGHFAQNQGPWVNLSGKYGYTGVYVFFVISGFIIPYSLQRGGYTIRNFGRFILKRSIRIYPPYLLSIPITVLAFSRLVHPHSSYVIHMTLWQVCCHLLYLSDLVGSPWVNVVYWTLAIEFQWYLLAGLLHGLFVSRNAVVRFIPVAVAVAIYFLTTSDRIIFHGMPVFLIGVFVFQYKMGLIGWRRMLCLIAVMTWAMRGPTGWLIAEIAAATGLVIAFVSFRNHISDFLGDVSYSVYLFHVPIGVTVVSWLSYLLPYSGSYLFVLDIVGISASVAGAFVLYRWVEKPAQNLASRIRFLPGRRQEPVLAAAVAAE